MNTNILMYRVGVEQLDENYKPLEHIDYWDIYDLTEATEKFNTTLCEFGKQAKYLKVIFRDKTEAILETWGYINNHRVRESLVFDIKQECDILEQELERVKDDSYQNIKARIEESMLAEVEKTKCMEILDDLTMTLQQAYTSLVCYLDNIEDD